jgi:hypothetical protein
MLQQLSVYNHEAAYPAGSARTSYEAAGLEDFELFWDNKPVNGLLYRMGLLVL